MPAGCEDVPASCPGPSASPLLTDGGLIISKVPICSNVLKFSGKIAWDPRKQAAPQALCVSDEGQALGLPSSHGNRCTSSHGTWTQCPGCLLGRWDLRQSMSLSETQIPNPGKWRANHFPGKHGTGADNNPVGTSSHTCGCNWTANPHLQVQPPQPCLRILLAQGIGLLWCQAVREGGHGVTCSPRFSMSSHGWGFNQHFQMVIEEPW